MRTTLAAWLAGIACAFIVLAFLFLDWRLLLLTLPSLVYLAISGLTPVPKPMIDVSCNVSQDRVSVGQEVQVTLKVVNRGSRLDLVEIHQDVPKELDVPKGFPHIALALDSGEELALEYVVVPRMKGIHSLGPLVVRSMGASGLEFEEVIVPIKIQITVAPQIEDLRRAKIQPRRMRLLIGQILSRRAGTGTEFRGLREYRQGDEIRQINWKASARFDSLITNEMEGEWSGDAVIVVDARYESLVGPLPRSTTEHCVRAALALASKILQGRNRVGLIVERGVLDWLYPGYGRKQLYLILDALIRARPTGEWALDHFVWVLERFFPRNCHAILVSPLLDAETVSTVTDLAARGFAITVVSPSSVEIERAMYADDPALAVPYRLLRMERENVVSALRRYADVVDWNPREPLAAALREVRPSPRAR